MGAKDGKQSERASEPAAMGESVLVGLWVCRPQREGRLPRCLMCCNVGQGQRGPTLSLSSSLYSKLL